MNVPYKHQNGEMDNLRKFMGHIAVKQVYF